MVKDFTERFAVTYPVGYVSSETVDAYLGRGKTERMRVPQIVVIDRKGVIRAQSLPDGEKNLEDEQYLCNLLDGLLNEGQPPSDASSRRGARYFQDAHHLPTKYECRSSV
jgi:hypothetical protein